MGPFWCLSIALLLAAPQLSHSSGCSSNAIKCDEFATCKDLPGETPDFQCVCQNGGPGDGISTDEGGTGCGTPKCPSGMKRYRRTNTCYSVKNGGGTWDSLRKACTTDFPGSDLAALFDGGADEFIDAQVILTDGLYWTGYRARDIKGYFAASNYRASEPVEPLGETTNKGDCVAIQFTKGSSKMVVRDCDNQQGIYGGLCSIPLVRQACGDGWKEVNGACYYPIQSKSSYMKQALYCSEMGGELAIFQSKKDQDVVVTALKLDTGDYYLGFQKGYLTTDETKIKDLKGETVQYSPDYEEGSDVTGAACVAIISYSGAWKVVECSKEHPAICQKHGHVLENCPTGSVTFGKFCVSLRSKKESEPDAKSTCLSVGGELVSINTAGKQEFLKDYLAAQGVSGRAWIGLKEGSVLDDYKWEDDSALSYTNWANGKPNDNTAGSCVYFDGSSSLWGDVKAPCSQKYFPVCEYINTPCSKNGDCLKDLGECFNGQCRCKAGYHGDGQLHCKDVNECEESPCDSSAKECANTVGSYKCVCPDGFAGDGTKRSPCYNPSKCRSNKDCNTHGTCNSKRACVCKDGYEGDGKKSCTNINECKTGAHKCDPKADCEDTKGSYKCICKNGYTGNGKTCKPLPTNCHEILLQDKKSKNGLYFIDPDFEGILDKVRVKCRFQDDIGITIFEHNRQRKQEVKRNRNPVSVKQIINYVQDVLIPHINAVVDDSLFCMQSITYSCQGPLSYTGNNVWLDRNGTKVNDLDGVTLDSDNAMCPCGAIGACDKGRSVSCNCNSKLGSRETASDVGIVTDRRILPITSYIGGGTKRGRRGYFEVGPLMCGPEQFDIPTDCNDAKLNYGGKQNGVRFIDVDGKGSIPPFYAYCKVDEWTNTAITEIPTPSDDPEGEPEPADGPGPKKIPYPVPEDAPKKLAENSKFCLQEVEYTCNNSPVSGESSLNTFFTDSSSNKFANFIDLPDAGDNTCPCGVLNSCEKGQKKCNCDNNDGQEYVEFGTIIDKDRLPISEINVGSVGKKAGYKLGRLRCGDEQFGIYGSCQELRYKGYTRSGPYFIDPDGPPTPGGYNKEPFLVQCDFDPDKPIGVTVVPPGEPKFPDEGESPVDYPTAPLDEIKGLLDRSAYCTQEITYNCKKSRIFNGDENLASWFSLLGGKERTYFDGSGDPDNTCTCGIDQSCLDSDTHKCNCDGNSESKDTGILKNKAHLPVGKVRFTDISGGSKASFELGPLKCYELFETCEMLKKNYRATRGLPRLRNGKFVIDPDLAEKQTPGFSVYCSFPRTVVYIDRDDDLKTTKAKEPQCYDIDYDATVIELKLLAQKSAHCQQKVSFQSKYAPFSSQVTWTNINDKPGVGWGSSNGADECACGVVNKCSGGPEDKCNTDSVDGGTYRDEGWLIDKEVIPVRKICMSVMADPTKRGWARYQVKDFYCGPSYFDISPDCQQYRKRGIRITQALLIDPDQNKKDGVLPFTVWCEMTKDPPNGVTIITSEDETCQSIPEKGGDIAVKYNAAQIDQVTAIKKRSVYCEQEISYECNNAELTFSDKAGWYDQSGAVKKYWGGNSGGTGCAGGKCQCSNQDGKDYQDGGKLLDIDALPVSKFTFNAITSGGKRCIKVGSLKCYEVYKDCQEIKQLNKQYNMNRNNRYAIDPDRAGGVEYFGVTCDFNTDRSMGITVVGLDGSNDVTSAKEITVKYKTAVIDQIKALVNESEWCRQKLEYRCKNALLINDDNSLNTYFKTYDGTSSKVWPGADKNYGEMVGCACVLLDSCPAKSEEESYTCKCDAQDGKGRYEGGYITNRDILPVSGLVRGPLKNGAQGAVDIGEVMCAPKPFSLPKDCEMVENKGFKSGEYLIWPDSSVEPFLVYCDTTIKRTRGVTVLKPKESVLDISKGEKRVTYLEATNEQVIQLVAQSRYCYQPVRVMCNSFPLFNSKGVPNVKWLEPVKNSFKEKSYFGSSTQRNKECSCGNDNSCGGDDGRAAMQKRRCNCDIGDATDRVDAGVMRVKWDLPVGGFRTKNNIQGSLKVEVGNLYCADTPFDINVCDTDFHDCHVNATCVKRPYNAYACQCVKGWQGLNRPEVWANGRECYDDDECAKSPCNNAITATCVNTPGSYYCKCNEGFTESDKDQDKCVDFNECKAETHNCHKDATCINIYGSFVCACNRGFRGNGTYCEPIGECICWGDPHCLNFDDKYFHFYGPCSYTMARDNCANGIPQGEPTFQIDQINWRQGRKDTRASWIEAIQINVYGAEIILGQNKTVAVDGILVPGFSSRPLTRQGYPDLLIIKAGPYVRVTTDQGLEVRWDGNTKVDIIVSADFQNNMCGMCGNFNGDKEDEFIAGDACPNAKPGTQVDNSNTFSASWLSGSSNDFSVDQCTEYCDLPLEDICKKEGNTQIVDKDCGEMFSEDFDFWPCLQKIDDDFRDMLLQACKIDLCAGVDKCIYAENLADLCQQTYKSSITTWRSGSYCGTPACGDNMEYKTCGSMCQPSCVYPDGVPGCLSECVTGCFCKDGFVMEEGKCVKPTECGCIERGVYIEANSKLLVNCSYQCTCSPDGLKCKDYQCTQNSTCAVREQVLDCYCHEGFEKNGEECDDIDECERLLDDCHDFASCTNLVPGFVCTCNDGYVGDGVKNCQDVDECTVGTNECDLISTECSNSDGSYKCKCKAGFSRINDTHCKDVDECASNRDNCDPISTDCRNTEGAFACDCKKNFREFDATSCQDIDECAEDLDNCHDNATCGNTLGDFTCVCNTGFKGNGVNCTDIDECKQNTDTCVENEVCTNTVGSFVCVCEDGYERDAKQVCTDIDECQRNLDDCFETEDGGICTDTDGSYECSCAEGYEGDGSKNGTGCSDVDECDRDGPAVCGENSKCTNLVPGYSCNCNDGYESLSDDGQNCELIPTCENTDMQCDENSTCQDSGEGPSCECNNGYRRADDKTCLDIDECEEKKDHCNGDNMICKNNPGGYECDCIKGYLYNAPLHKCHDIDECSTDDYECMEQSYCTNTNGSYECICIKGYEKKANDEGDETCENVNECEVIADLCDVNANCTDTPGSYKCTCNIGYSGDGVTCNELPRCKDEPCAVHAVCTDYPGGYDCQCVKGYEGDGFNCTNINECEKGLDNCSPNSRCEDTPGGYICRCRVGFEGHCDDCWDIDECNTGLHDCKTFSNCINTVGSYRCECERGFIYRENSCQDINECSLGIDECDDESEICINIRGSYSCKCKEGYKNNTIGDCIDVNECKEGCPYGCSMCDIAAECINTPGSYKCICNPGFAGDGRICIAEDPSICGDKTCDPNADCIQRSADPKDLFCVCQAGFTGLGYKDEDKPGCEDVSSCDVKNPCSPPGTCVNSKFGQVCVCPRGYITIGYECIATDPCSDPYACFLHATCNSTNNVNFTCTCDTGYEEDDVNKVCRDIDECSSEETYKCPDKSECVNFEGSYSCVCDVGYRMNADKTACEDIDECEERTDNCDEESRATCTNEDGGFTCECLPRFIGNGIVCLEQDAPDCKEDCPENSFCADHNDGPSCACRDGYNQTSAEGEPITCEDIDECAEDPCESETLRCVNRPGGYDCICPLGYEGIACSDINECDDPRSCSVHADCENSEGSFKCTCKDGFRGDGVNCYALNPTDDPCKCGPNGICVPTTLECKCKLGYDADYNLEKDKCQDIDDCLLPDRCHSMAKCVDIIGGYYCECPEGFAGDGVEFCTKDSCSANADCDENAECKTVGETRQCVCNDGYIGDGATCTAETEPCETVKCTENAYCIAFDKKPLCVCLAGYQGNGEICDDIDECVEYPPHCHPTAVCENSPGTYSCKCAEGYKSLDSLDGACQDVNECDEGLANCDINAECSNDIGGYTCTCKEGFIGSGRTCQPDNACEAIGGCVANSTCSRNSKGGYSCLCDGGFVMEDDRCKEVNECLLNLDSCTGNEDCVDTYGSYKCVCKEGYAKSGITCIDINECAEGAHSCPDGSTCVNTEGSFKCICKPGFLFDGKDCVENDACSAAASGSGSAEGPCDGNATCINSNSEVGYECKCNEGFTGNGLECTPIDPCDLKECQANSRCDSSDGTTRCICVPGYEEKDGKCEDIDECEKDNDCDEEATCKNNEGSYTCTCNEGFIGNGRICEEGNPCSPDPCNSDATCTSEDGSAVCTCFPGFTGDGKNCRRTSYCDSADSDCPVTSECKETSGGFECKCKDPLVGDGYNCKEQEKCPEDCGETRICTSFEDGKAQCECKEGYAPYGESTCEGKACGRPCSDIDECSLPNECSENAKCINEEGGYSCKCKAGFEGNGKACIDVNECLEGICGSGASCFNTVGSCACACPEGMAPLLGTCSKCIDINECNTGDNNCPDSADCINEKPGFSCRCKSGYRGTDGYDCEDIDECTETPGICGLGKCSNIQGGFKCECPDGYRFDGSSCSNVDECSLPAGSDGSSQCVNAECEDETPGYKCNCKPGFERISDLVCQDVNECKVNPSICEPAGDCVNEEGGYTCTCPQGYEYNGKTCTDINECGQADVCGDPAFSICINIAGSFQCLCRPGYKYNGKCCIDIDECTELDEYPCDISADCANNKGGFECLCQVGYKYRNNMCVDIDECTEMRNPCGDTGDCENTQGSFLCTCRPGYKKSGDNCRPICDYDTCRPFQHCRVVDDQPVCTCLCSGPDCYERGPVCGSDGVTYPSMKNLVESRCTKQASILKINDGKCVSSCADLPCPNGKYCEVVDGLAKCTCQVQQCTIPDLQDRICSTDKNEYPRCLFYTLKCIGRLEKETIDYNGTCVRDECVYRAWSSWASCSATCGLGSRIRTRELADVLHAKGLVCNELNETMDCVNPTCPGDVCEDTNHTCTRPESTCVDRNGKPVCECPTCDAAPETKICGIINGEQKTFKNLCHFRYKACKLNAKDHTYLHDGPCNTGQNLPLRCTMLPFYTKVRSERGYSRDIMQTNRCYGGCGTEVGVCCLPTTVQFNPTFIKTEEGSLVMNQFAVVTSCECIEREKRPNLRDKLLAAAIDQGFIIPDAFHELMAKGQVAEENQKSGNYTLPGE